jgi:hypothetical protein
MYLSSTPPTETGVSRKQVFASRTTPTDAWKMRPGSRQDFCCQGSQLLEEHSVGLYRRRRTSYDTPVAST